MERYAGSHVAEYMTRSVPVPNEEIKGRIIGREGRNIRAFEQVTGCSILVDDTPGMVVVSAADPLRRELGSLTLERLIASGRIQPQRIEELYELERQRFAQHLTDIGQQAATEADVNIASDEVLQTLGRLAYRLSYSQNVLRHSQEVAAYAGLLASELGLDPETARKVGLLHDIGKALDQTAQGPHALIGAEFLRKQGESEDVVEGVAGHHGEAQTHTVWAVLASVADTLSSVRPGARFESIDRYVNRIGKLESLAMEFPGVTRAFAYQAGRDLRILVDAEKTSDAEALLLARSVAAKISQDGAMPGQVRVTVIRETRCVEYAH